MIEQADLLTKREVATRLRVCTKTVEARVKDGSLPAPLKLGRRLLFKRSELEEALLKLKEQKANREPQQ